MRFALLLLVACSGKDEGTEPTPTTPTPAPQPTTPVPTTPTPTPTNPTEPASVIAATCAVQPDNVLRFDCQVTTDNAGPVRIRVTDGGAELATWSDDTEAREHTLTLWGLRSQATYGFEAYSPESASTVVSGTLTTGPLPAAYDLDLPVTVSGTSGAPMVMFNWGCGGPGSPEALIAATPDGHIVWYQDASGIDPAADTFRGYSVTPEGTVLATIEREWVVEWDLAGHVLMNFSIDGGDLSTPMHHDIERKDGLTYVVTARGVPYPDGNLYVIDGFDVLDAGGLISSFSIEGLFDPTIASPASGDYWGNLLGVDAIDWAHANAIAIDDAGDVYLSLRFMDGVIKVAGDPTAPDFGALRWYLTGSSAQPFPSDLALSSSAGITPVDFGDQHHVWIDAQGALRIWDNRPSAAVHSRALKIEVDEGAGTADMVEAWDAGRWCPGQGSAFELPNGNMLIDCAGERLFLEIERSTQQEVWRMEPACKAGAPRRLLYRGVPIDLYPPAP